jgi:RNA polymerase sigma-70 factor (ECF subfamily)
MPPIETELLERRAPDTELLSLMRAGQSTAFAVLMRRNNQRLYRLARSIVRDDSEAEEVVQESYVRAFTHIEGFKGESSLATWLARIVLNEALGRLRRRHPAIGIDEMAQTPDAGGDPPLIVQDHMSPEHASARQEIRRAIENAIDRLSPPFRAVFIMRAIEQMSIAETADCLGIPGDTVKTRFHRANKLLRQALSAQFGSILEGAFPFLGARCDRLVTRVLERLGNPVGAACEAPSSDRPAGSQNTP